jgi:hypothetical protein
MGARLRRRVCQCAAYGGGVLAATRGVGQAARLVARHLAQAAWLAASAA